LGIPGDIFRVDVGLIAPVSDGPTPTKLECPLVTYIVEDATCIVVINVSRV